MAVNANEIIGQTSLLTRIECNLRLKFFPRCSLFIGMKGSGRKTIAQFVAKKLGAECIISDIGISDVREVIKVAYSTYNKLVFVFPDIERMSNKAENALLKLLEEPPNNVYIILTARSEYNVLNTIRSRCVLFSMDYYSPQDLFNYFWQLQPDGNPNDAEVIQQVCETPGDVREMLDAGVSTINDYADLVIENIADVSGANALKIGSKIAFKDTDTDKIDLMLFFKTFRQKCADRLTSDIKYARWIRTTDIYIDQLSIKGINKVMLFDNWVLDCRDDVFFTL